VKLWEILIQAIREVAEEEGIPEEEIWKVIPKVKERAKLLNSKASSLALAQKELWDKLHNRRNFIKL